MKVKSIGILAGLGGLAIGTVVSGMGATVLLSNKDNELAKCKEENEELNNKVKLYKAQSMTDVIDNAKAMGEMSEELNKASKKLTEALDTIDKERQTVEDLKGELGATNKNLKEAYEQIETRVSEINSLKEEIVNCKGDFESKLKEKDKEITKLKNDIKKLNKEIDKYTEIKEAMEVIKATDNNLDEAKKLALDAEKQHKSVGKRISKSSKK